MIPSSMNSGNRAAYKRSTSVLGNCESRIQTSSMIEVRFCLKWRVSCTSDAHKELETYLSLFISLTLNRHCIILEYEKRKMWRSLHVLWQVSFISSYVHRILREWFRCSFGSEIMTWKERVWGVCLLTEGGLLATVGDGGGLAFL